MLTIVDQIQMGYGSPRHVSWGQTDIDDSTGVRIWESRHGTDSGGINAQYVLPFHNPRAACIKKYFSGDEESTGCKRLAGR